MSIVYHIDKETGLAFVLWDRNVVPDEFLAHAQRLLSDPEWPPHRYLQLSDLRTAVLDAMFDEAIFAKAADIFGRHAKISSLKVAVVANKAFEKAITFERFILRYLPSMVVFNDLHTACIWLDIDEEIAAEALQALRAFSRNQADQ